MSKLKSPLLLFAVQFVQYCICCVSYIVLNRGQYGLTFVTDTIFGLNSFFIVKRIAKADAAGWDAVGYTLGGATGSILAIWITKHWLHQ